jgi:metal-responsive CopG/Arc/MetJ family transcriptional regulator
MGNIKTAISIKKPLFDQVDALANELDMSRSGLFALAVKEFILRYKNQKMLQDLNDAYDDIPDSKEENLMSRMRSQHYQQVEDQW